MQFYVHRLPDPQAFTDSFDNDAIHTKTDSPVEHVLGTVGLQDVHRIGTEAAAGLVDRGHRTARAGLGGLELDRADDEALGVVFLARLDAIDDNVRPKTVHGN